MSADDQIGIVKIENGKYRGYMIFVSASHLYDSKQKIMKNGTFKFEADSVKEAAIEAQKIHTEYGYFFYNFLEENGYSRRRGL